ncbi:hypothetical protein GDO81_026780 [Engystomops pustulosus]|uniref:Uncharacterized protein n=1 Tax=Engystomops pustulosus TaxID=76066 RepID=A0AAV6YYJ3_ENGPU|nr:hypothetical protein GDO81_026780 [Engystomops pustulosus]
MADSKQRSIKAQGSFKEKIQVPKNKDQPCPTGNKHCSSSISEPCVVSLYILQLQSDNRVTPCTANRGRPIHTPGWSSALQYQLWSHMKGN